ncbi:hypothetical protein RHSIM_Rhsim03G0092700 [Rhododendron simsii]|uniref:hAT-like transposase RNase-H fold domain-containing protein n=1 Tax=Rhododendron simsii TaxID=118357 RepID=A0A834H8B4_RHOSS|nr:hypothetical protein RHSIM_Rhsim03G0092700 [Rhododendron simsii]
MILFRLVMDSSNFDFTLGGELEDDVVDVEEVELGDNSNPLGLKDTSEYILPVRDIVRYVRSSPQTMETFNKCLEKEKIKSKQTVSLDVCTRWNSTYLMLEVAIKFEKAFQRMGEEDSNELITNRDPFMSSMAIEMKRKFERYWGDGEKFNALLYVAVAMDPQFKLRLVKFCYTKSKGKTKGEVRQNVSSASPIPRVMEENENCDHRLNLAIKFNTYLEEEYSSVCSMEVGKYLGDLCERRDNPDFDILAIDRVEDLKRGKQEASYNNTYNGVETLSQGLGQQGIAGFASGLSRFEPAGVAALAFK